MSKCKIKEELAALKYNKVVLESDFAVIQDIYFSLQEDLKENEQLISHYEYLLNNPHLEKFIGECKCPKKKSNKCKKK